MSAIGPFDLFTIRRWREGYTLQAKIARPRNAPQDRYTDADMERARAAAEVNLRLGDRMFPTLPDVMAEIEALEAGV